MSDFNTTLARLIEAKEEKVYKVIKTKGDRTYEQEGTLAELIQAYSYSLDTGRSYQNEKGNKKIDTNPKTIASLVKNLENAANNAARNGYAGLSFSFEVVTKKNTKE